MNFQTYKSENGIRFIHVPSSRVVSNAIVLINTGTRDERPDEHGMAHFIEHLIFKGTHKRSYLKILQRMEEIGGDLDAYTTKEETCIYSTFLPQYFERALELLSDIVFNSVFYEKQINLEREVIKDEIASYIDTPSELIYDEFEELIFDGHALGRNILGTEKSLDAINRSMIIEFYKRTYNTNQMIVCTAGNIPFEKVLSYFKKYFATHPENLRKWRRTLFKNYAPGQKEVRKNTKQAYCIIGNLAYSIKHKDRLTLHLLNNILGGNSSSSRLNLVMRERNGLVYFIESGYNPYTDAGVFYIYFSTEKKHLDKAINLVLNELRKLKEIELKQNQLERAKRQFYAQFALSLDNQENLAINTAKSLLIFNKVDPIEQLQKELSEITSFKLQQVANEIFNENKLSILKYI